MRSLFLLMPILSLLFFIIVTAVFLYAMIALVKSNRLQAESLKEIEMALKRMAEKESN